jgi:fatty acyl-CoA reductase
MALYTDCAWDMQIPGDMVVNAMMVAMAAHSGEQAQTIYHVTSSLRNPAPYAVLSDAGHRYFFANPPPRAGKNGRLRRMRFFSTVASFRAHMAINYKLPLEVSLLFVDLISCFEWFDRNHI